MSDGIRLVIVGAAFLAGLFVGGTCSRVQLAQERLARFNAEAAADSSRLVYSDSVRRVSERLAFQERGNIVLRGELGRALRRDGERTELLARVRVQLDSLAGVVGRGTVTTGSDSSIRLLAASLDTSGYHVSISAEVPPPPSEARVTWGVRRDPVEIVAALNRDPEGRAALRVAASGFATAQIDTVRVKLAGKLERTRRLALPLVGVLVGYIMGRLLR